MHIYQIKNKEGVVLQGDEQNKERWEEYFNHLLNEKNERLVFENGIPNHSVTTRISREVIVVVQKMKSRKATGPDEIPVQV